MTLLPARSKNDGFLFDTSGKAHGTPSKEFYKERRRALEEVAKNFPTHAPTLCGCSHEKLIARHYTADELPTVIQNQQALHGLVVQCLCPLQIRINNDLCAHGGKNLKPNPLGGILLELDRLQLLDQTSWNEWYNITSKVIHDIDSDVGERRRERDVESVITNARERQRIIGDAIQEARQMLASFLVEALEFSMGDS